MLSTVPISKVQSVFHRDDKEVVAQRLQTLGIAEVEFLDRAELAMLDVPRDSPTEKASLASGWILRLAKLIEVLAPFDKKEESIMDELLGIERISKVEVEADTIESLTATAEKVVSDIEKDVQELNARKKELEPIINEKKVVLQQCERLVLEDFDISWLGESKYLYVAAATIPRESLPLVDAVISDSGINTDEFIMVQVPSDSPLIVMVSYKSDRRRVDKALHTLGAERIRIDGKGSLAEFREQIEKEIIELTDEKDVILSKLSEYSSSYLSVLRALDEVFRVYKARYEVFTKDGRTKKTTIMRCYVPTSKVEELKSTIINSTGGACVFAVEDNPPNSPSVLNNPSFAKPFEMLTRTYGYPHYNHIDPTLFLIPTFLMFTGMMINDFGYGVIIAIVGFLLYKGYGVFSEGVKELSLLILFWGVAAAIFGVLTGNYFGDLVGRYILGGNGAEDIALWMDPLEAPEGEVPAVIVIYRLTVFVGLLHLIMGLIMGMYNSVRNGEYRKAMLHYGGWSLFGIALAILLFTPLGALLAFPVLLPKVMLYVGLGVLVIGLLLAVVEEPMLTIVEIPTFIAFMLSYARILGLMVAAGGVALAFNRLAATAFDSVSFLPLAVLFAVLVFLFGHVIHLLLGGLSSFIQSLRLHYVEHFSRYYEGDGREFEPFNIETEYAIIKKEVCK
ncbi:MAG: V-type ATP synthase subunit I [Methermicoccaceae archaeon]